MGQGLGIALTFLTGTYFVWHNFTNYFRISKLLDASSMPVSSEEQTRNLMEQLKEESSLPDRTSWQNEIEARFARLKGIDPDKKVM